MQVISNTVITYFTKKMRLYGLFFLPFCFNIISPLNNKVCWSLSSRMERGDFRVPKLKVRILVLRTVLLLFWIDSDNLKYSKEVILIAYTCLWLLKIFIRLKMASMKSDQEEFTSRTIYSGKMRLTKRLLRLADEKEERGGEYQKQKSCHQSNLKAQWLKCITQILYETSAR